ncbi:hypothetical protein [Collimonas sp.]|jgi:hypothetical protein|uniref:hypothetical protein n=1 Tax=Collimonas sp. TaxID=1963772 RepID=UPI002B74B76B|nr:hypothetical protein [Collimonas sp.]HWW08137.1 hypothetical protein [Collimonas sp.]
MALKISREAKKDVLTLRVSEKTRYGLDLLSRVTGKTLSQLLTESLEPLLQSAQLHLPNTQSNLFNLTWSPFDSDRLVNLAVTAPDLLTLDEERIWTVIREQHEFFDANGDPRRDAIRGKWPQIQQATAKYQEKMEE